MTYRNLMLTMLLGGLWHGANWNFPVWGAYHGASGNRASGSRQTAQLGGWTLVYPSQVVLTFALVTIGLRDPPGVCRWRGCDVAAALATSIAEERRDAIERLMVAPAWAYASALALMLFCLEVFGVIGAAIPFLYFQF